jgi:hypothetical protein
MPLPLSVVNPVAFDVNGLSTDSSRTFRIAVLSEGFLPGEMKDFRDAVFDIVKELNATQPFRRRRDRIHIVRIECTSLASATQLRRLTNPPAGYINKTPFDVRFRTTVARGMSGNRDAVHAVVRATPGVPPVSAMVVLVNNTEHGGEADGDVAWMTLDDTAPTFVHELGHAGFGLADEYEYQTATAGEAPRTYSGGEPVAPNITTQQTRATIPWRAFFKPTGVAIPTTSGPCQFDHPVVSGTPSGAIGLFEGGSGHACGVFRPSATCKMREHGDFCAVCEHTIFQRLSGALLSARAPFIVSALPWTHVAPVPPTLKDPDIFDIAAYDLKTGLFAIYFGNEFEGNITPAGTPRAPTTLDPGFTTVAAFSAGLEQFVYLENVFTRRQMIFRIDRQGMLLPGNPALITQFERPPQPVPPFGFSHMLPLSLGGQALLLHYDRITGALDLEIFNPLTRMPVPVASTAAGSMPAWRASLSSLTSIVVNGVPHVVGLNATTRQIVFARVELATATSAQLKEVLVLNGVVLPFQTHLLGFEFRNMPMLFTYETLGGTGSLYEVRANLSGLDQIYGWTLTPGAAALFDVGLPAFGFMPPVDLGGGTVGRLWFYNAGLRRFAAYTFH